MKLYILRVCPTGQKGISDGYIIGIFTRKDSLIKAIRANAAALGLDNCEGFKYACRDEQGRWFEEAYCLSEYLDTGMVETIDANTVYPDGI